MAKKLTDKQEMFCREYMIDLNATQAAIRAGYSEKTSHSIGAENLTKPEILTYLTELKKKRADKVDIKAEDILRELKSWAYGDFTEVMEMSFTDIKELPIEIRRLITGFERTVSINGDSSTEKIKITFVDKKAAFDMINKHISFYAPEKSEIELTDKKKVVSDLFPPEEEINED